VNAIAAFISSGRLSWKAASSITARPCFPRRLEGRELSATILCPEAKRMRYASRSRRSSSRTTSSIACAALLNWRAHAAAVSTNSRAMSRL